MVSSPIISCVSYMTAVVFGIELDGLLGLFNILGKDTVVGTNTNPMIVVANVHLFHALLQQVVGDGMEQFSDYSPFVFAFMASCTPWDFKSLVTNLQRLGLVLMGGSLER